MTLIEIQKDVLKKHNIILCDGTMCDGSKCPYSWKRMHSCSMARKIYKWDFKNSIKSTFDLFHEIGHQETTTSKMRRCESEYHATVWAINKAKEYGIADKITDTIKNRFQNYINMELERGVRRGGKGYPTKEQLTLKW